MTADSVPAPMVQVPAELLDNLKAAFDEFGSVPGNGRKRCLDEAFKVVRFYTDHRSTCRCGHEMDLHQSVVGGTACFGFECSCFTATPAASVPAADILALAEKWYPGTPGPRRMTSWARLAYQDCARELRALVDERQPQRCEHGILRRLDCFECNEIAAAEQADKGEPAATPRRKCYACGSTLEPDEYGELEWCPKCEPAESRPAPAAPPEPLCRCDHSKSTHHFISDLVTGCSIVSCPCQKYDARVPVNDEAEASNDEAEASTVASFAPLLTPEERASLVRNLADGPLRWVSREFADFPEIRFDKANEIMGRLEPLLESLVAARLAETWRRGYLDHAQFEPPSNEYIDALNPFRAARQGGNSDE